MNPTFHQLQVELFKLFNEQKFHEVDKHIEEVERLYPKRQEKTLFWKACAAARQGKIERAISTLYNGIENGIWWNRYTLTNDPDLTSLQSEDTFKQLIEECDHMFKQEQKISRTQLHVYGNPDADTSIFTLHWRGSNNHDFAPYWLDEKTENYQFAFLQSSQIYGYQSYCWDNQSQANDDIATNLQTYISENKQRKVVIAGASQGGKLAIQTALSNQFSEVNQFIAVIPSISDLTSFETLITEVTHPIKGYIITGDKDPFYQQTVTLFERFKDTNIDCQLLVKQELGHYFPQDFPSLLSIALKQM
ncbi:TPR end-of-group domain-containing protein [Alkalihalobacillus pseudalcaliphilus]|uniref:TPR end-of-group domain-containing protein n=1 Tax=Alkalihalobacillus pseudalcaliphilus TaxID=79884 RepID=UPI00064E0CD7|nr:dienelactone hydrolase family protein [Alkalihalobacillus pseudalcaliphilus]KMK75859.1 group-specific protein [Alkalihalobacillus pseudalcaliphilus]